MLIYDTYCYFYAFYLALYNVKDNILNLLIFLYNIIFNKKYFFFKNHVSPAKQNRISLTKQNLNHYFTNSYSFQLLNID